MHSTPPSNLHAHDFINNGSLDKNWLQLALWSSAQTSFHRRSHISSNFFNRLCQHSSLFLLPFSSTSFLIDIDNINIEHGKSRLVFSPTPAPTNLLSSLSICSRFNVPSFSIGDFGRLVNDLLLISVPRGKSTPDHKPFNRFIEERRISGGGEIPFHNLVVDGARSLQILTNSNLPSFLTREPSRSRSTSRKPRSKNLSNLIVIGDDMPSIRGSSGRFIQFLINVSNSLECLQLYSVTLQSDNFQQLQNLLCSKMLKLKHLSLISCYWDGKSVQELLNDKVLNGLESLIVVNDNWQPTIQSIASLAPSLNSLTLHETTLRPATLKAIFNHQCSKLVNLSLVKGRIDGAKVTLISKLIGCLHQLRILNLSDNPLGKHGLDTLLKSLISIQQSQDSKSEALDHHALKRRPLVYLGLRSLSIDEKCLDSLTHFIQSKGCPLILDLSCNNLVHSSTENERIKFIQAIGGNDVLEAISFTDTDIEFNDIIVLIKYLTSKTIRLRYLGIPTYLIRYQDLIASTLVETLTTRNIQLESIIGLQLATLSIKKIIESGNIHLDNLSKCSVIESNTKIISALKQLKEDSTREETEFTKKRKYSERLSDDENQEKRKRQKCIIDNDSKQNHSNCFLKLPSTSFLIGPSNLQAEKNDLGINSGREIPLTLSSNYFPPLRKELEYEMRNEMALLGSNLLQILIPPRPQRPFGESAILFLLKGTETQILMALNLILRGIVTVTFPDLVVLERLVQKRIPIMMKYLLHVVLEEILVTNLTHKFQRLGLLDLDDRLTVPGVVFHDGGPNSQALHSIEFRLLWNRKHGILNQYHLKSKYKKIHIPTSSVFDLLPLNNQPCQTNHVKQPAERYRKQRPTLLKQQIKNRYRKSLHEEQNHGYYTDRYWLFHLNEYITDQSLCPKLTEHSPRNVLSSSSDKTPSKKAPRFSIHTDFNEIQSFNKIQSIDRLLIRIGTSIVKGHCPCRETIAVDFQSDLQLRRIISQAQTLKMKILNSSIHDPLTTTNSAISISEIGFSASIEFVEALRHLVLKRIKTDGNDSKHKGDNKLVSSMQVSELAYKNGGFVPIGEIRYGESRHMGILFKVLCDATATPCRLLRWVDNKEEEYVYNVVLIDSSKHGSTSTVDVTEKRQLERLYPVWWPSINTVSTYPRGISTHQLPHHQLRSIDHPIPPRLRHKLDDIIFKMSTEEELDLDKEFEFVDILGKGSFGEVWRVALKDGGTTDEPSVSKRKKGSKNGSRGNSDSINCKATDEIQESRKSLLAPLIDITRIHDVDSIDYGSPFIGSSQMMTEEQNQTSREMKRILIKNKKKIASNGQYWALKLVPYSDENVPEAEMLRNYSHPRIVSFLGVFKGFQILENRQKKKQKITSLCLLMDLADKSLEQFIEANQKTPSARQLDPRFIRSILLDTARAMAYLHHPSPTKPHLLHRDLKPANILIKKTSSGYRALVTDFGVARLFEPFDANMTMGPGTEGYIAPEQYSQIYDRPADVWSFGVVIARLLGVQDWKSFNHLKLPRIEEFKLKDQFLIELCFSCLEPEPMMRPTFDQIVRDVTDDLFRFEFERSIRLVSNGRNLHQNRFVRFADLNKNEKQHSEEHAGEKEEETSENESSDNKEFSENEEETEEEIEDEDESDERSEISGNSGSYHNHSSKLLNSRNIRQMLK